MMFPTLKGGLLGLCLVVVLAVGTADAQVLERSQVALQNNTTSTVDLKVDGELRCRALANFMCVTQVTPGSHAIEAGGYSRIINVEGGAVFTWTIPDNG